MGPEQKYLTETTLLQATKSVALTKPAELEGFAARHPEIAQHAHIYFVCQRPRVRVIDAEIRRAEEIRVVLSFATEMGTTERELVIPAAIFHLKITSVCREKGGAYLKLSDEHGATALMPPEYLLRIGDETFPELANLEVIYVGQAYGESGARSAIDRLKAHSTLQKVLADQQHVSWWMEAVLLLFVFDDHQLVSVIDGTSRPAVTGDADDVHFQSLLEQPLSSAQLVTIAEASLIRYFQPQYNLHFKDNYPTTDLQHLKDAYRLDYSGIVTEIDTEGIAVKTFAKHRRPLGHHTAHFDLHDPKERFSFFGIVDFNQ